MANGGKGSRPRPFSVDQKTFDSNWDAIFKKENNTGTDKNEYQDVVSTEDCVDNALEDYKRQAQELWNDSCTSTRKK